MRDPRPRFPLLLRLAWISALFGGLASPAAAANRPLYLDPSQPIEARVRDLVSRLTLDEKGSLMKNGAAGVPRLGIPQYDWWNEALHGVARAGVATVFPQAIGMAATFDDDFLHTEAGCIGTEARAKYNDAIAHGNRARFHGLTFWSPNINIFRDPRWGRGQETYGEDPYLTSQMGMAFVRGLQGDDPRYLMAAACAKHFVVHSGPEPLRHNFDIEIDPADFHETYLPAFEALVRRAHVEAVMTAYTSLYGKPCAINPILYDLLYRQWGFDGHVVSDCGAIHDLYTTYKVAPDAAAAEAMAVHAGLCLRCGDEAPAIAEAVRRGLLAERDVDLRLGQLLRTMFRLGFFDPPSMVPYSRIPISENNSPAHAALALRAARESIVLLKNDGTLPLKAEALHRVAVIGPNANSVDVLLGNYNGTPSAPITVLAGLRAALGSAVVYARGCDWTAAASGSQIIPPTQLQMGEDLTGLEGAYYPNRDLSGSPLLRRRDRPIDFDAAREDFRPKDLPADFSVRWTGKLLTGTAGDYRLSVVARGGFRLSVSGKTVIDAWDGDRSQATATVNLPENAALPVVLDYRTGPGAAAISLKWEPPAADSGFGPALALARDSDAVLFIGGLTAQLEGEEMPVDREGFQGGDRTKIELPEVQERLLQSIQALGKPVVLVLLSGSAVAVPWAQDHVDAIVEAWYPGQAGGEAVADVLLGRYNPAGRLPVTFYRSTADLPPFTDYRMANRTYRYFQGQPLYPFGFGLSYTRFSYSRINAPVQALPNGGWDVSVEVANAGDRAGDDVVQLYAREPAASHPRAKETLCGFRRVHLGPGERRTVSFRIDPTSLRRWDDARDGWTVPRGEWTFLAGGSSADLPQSASVRVP